jgi:thiol:disulfide interchange protein
VCFDNGICSPPGEAVIPLPGGFDWSLVLWLAFLGGLTLNVMPCVLPVLALKVLAKPSRVAAWATAAGVLATLLALGGLTLALQTAGKAVGWGFQFQSPWFSLLLIVVLVALALELWGVWTLPSLRFSRSGKPPSSDNLARDNPVAAFGNGVLIVALSTPCTAPFLGTALGLTLGAPPLALLAVFGLIGVGLALPSLVFSLVPTLTRWLPRPGAWTRWVSRLGGAALLATAVWLGTVAAGQLDLTPPAPPPAGWQAFEPAAVREAQAAGRPVVVEFTATWCLTCQVNEAGALKGEAFRQAVKDLNVALFWGDYTKPDPRIDAWLAEYGRAGVPFTLVLVPGKTPRVLPELLTTDVLVGALTPD